ncbi:LacI family DNA-binding transcriptional regulator [Gorillibacterium timonense]|uniref:LacI family DNA-binding transcriptional regulator n=1 Tax=Gorillibacterium timonense TaxID=1689269 RepID=UPI00071CC713|nr:LacI family DNA-binding transcriptional regulator [Gorillibacterium timonense]
MNIKKIAQLAGVSVSTVSKIINDYPEISEDTKLRVRKIMNDTGYIPSNSAKTLATKTSHLIGVIFAGKLNIDMTHPFFVEVVNAFKKQMGILGYDLLFFSNEKFQGRGDYPARCRHFHVDGCILLSGEELEPSIRELDASDIPCMGVDLTLSGPNSAHINSDNREMAELVVNHFSGLGYGQLGYLGSTESSEMSREREAGYREAMKKQGLPIREEWFLHADSFYEDAGYWAMKQLLTKGPLPRAIWAASDLLAFGAYRALNEHGLRIPEDVALVGCDDIEASRYIRPSLTTIRQDKETIGKYAALLLFDLINQQCSSPSLKVKPELIIRESCGTTKRSQR